MERVRVVTLGDEAHRAIGCVHQLGVVQIGNSSDLTPFGSAPATRLKAIQDQTHRLSDLAERLGAVLASLPEESRVGSELVTAALGRTTAELVSDGEAALAQTEPAARLFQERRIALDAELATLQRHAEVVDRLSPLAEALVALEGFDTIVVLIEPSYRFAVKTLRDELARLTDNQSEIVLSEAADGSVAILFVFARRFASEVHRLLQGERLTEVRLPADYQGRRFTDLAAEIRARSELIPSEIAELHEKYERTAIQHRERLTVLRAAVLDRFDELIAEQQCHTTDYAAVLEGWIPRRDVERVADALGVALDGRVAVERLPVTASDRASMPVLVENLRTVRPFEVLLALLPPPRYGSLDPTPFAAFFFPLFFGFALGDIGYGLLLLGLSQWWIQRRRGPDWAISAAQVIRLSAVVAIAFGFAFGELLGDLGHRFGLRPLLIDRGEAIPAMLLYSVGIGAVLVGLGLLLGAVNAYLQRESKELIAKLATFSALVAVFILLSVAGGLLPRGLLTPGTVLLLVATVLLVYSVGLVGPLEVFGALGNILSFTRLVAVGLASVILARVANDFAGLTGSIVIGVVVGALFHALNLALGLFSPSVHSLRLLYVEFFGHFLESGGQPFRPFKSRLAALLQ